MNQLICNEGCNQLFNISQLKIGRDALTGGIEHHYIQCPNCNHKYTSYYTNDEIRTMQVRVKALQNKAPLTTRDRNRLNTMIRQMQQASNKIKESIESNAAIH